MGDRPRDNNKQPAPAPRPRRAPGGYYYDDQTGYELYDPAGDGEEDEDGGGPEEAGGEEATGGG